MYEGDLSAKVMRLVRDQVIKYKAKEEQEMKMRKNN